MNKCKYRGTIDGHEGCCYYAMIGDEKICNDCYVYEPYIQKHKMIGCSDECIEFACCDFCKYVYHDFWFELDKNGEYRVVNGGPIGCGLHKAQEYQEIAEGCGCCPDFHCVSADEHNMVIRYAKEEPLQ